MQKETKLRTMEKPQMQTKIKCPNCNTIFDISKEREALRQELLTRIDKIIKELNK